MDVALELVRAKDPKERMAGIERLHKHLEASRKSLSSVEMKWLIECCMDLFRDGNFKVSQGALQVLASAAVLSSEHLMLHFNSLLPAVVERLGDSKQPVRDAARRLILTLMEVSSPTIIVERAGSCAWTNKSWRVRKEFARTVTSAVGLFASTELPLQRAVLPPILHMLNDPNPSVKESAVTCIKEMYIRTGPQFLDEIQCYHLPSYMIKDISAKLDKIELEMHHSHGFDVNACEVKSTVMKTKKNSPKTKNLTKDISPFGGESSISECPLEPINVNSERELLKEFEKIATTLVPEKDWSIRIAAMQRIECLVLGGASDFGSFRGLLKQLVGPLSTQLADRRSSIVKQACHVLCFLSKELLGDFEYCAETFIPVLFKLVVITVLVIADSADNCIKTMLRNCKVARALPGIADHAKNDRSPVLRARCCEYLLLILEHWADAPEIQRSEDLYEDIIKCCVADAISEVRSTARMCYRMFAKTWPEHSHRLFLSFDNVIQRIIYEEEGGLHRRHASPSIRERSSHAALAPQLAAPCNMIGYGTSSYSSGTSLSSGLLISHVKSVRATEHNLENVLLASKQKVTAIESLLKGLEVSDHQNLSTHPQQISLHLVPASGHRTNSFDPCTSSIHKNFDLIGGLASSNAVSRVQGSKESSSFSCLSSGASESLPAISSSSSLLLSSSSSYSTRRFAERLENGGFAAEASGMRGEMRHLARPSIEKHSVGMHYRDMPSYDSHSSQIPNFQRPLLRRHHGRISAGRSFDDVQLSLGEVPNSMEASISDALNEGLNPCSDWNARVSAFSYIRSLLQQGQGHSHRGVQAVVQNFDKVMKLFFLHLSDPHHKVAQAAFSALADIVPSCRKLFESYLERILPHVFSRLIDPKDLVRHPCSAALEIIGRVYPIDLVLLPALLRSLDEQRSPKAKLAVIEFAISSFNRHAMSAEVSSSGGSTGILKLWLAKLPPLIHDKNIKLKEAAVSCIISVYSHFDSAAVLNFILSLAVEEQNLLRCLIKQHTPRIEVDLVNCLHGKKDRHRLKSLYDPSDIVCTPSEEEGYIICGSQRTTYADGRKVSSSSSSQDQILLVEGVPQPAFSESREIVYENPAALSDLDAQNSKPRDLPVSPIGQTAGSWSDDCMGNSSKSINFMSFSTAHLLGNELDGLGHEPLPRLEADNRKPPSLKVMGLSSTGPSIPKIFNLICSDDNESTRASKHDALQQLIEASISNDHAVWSKYFNQILAAALEMLDDADASIHELVVMLIIDMLKNQKDLLDDSIELVIERLLHVSKNGASKVSNEAERGLSTISTEYDPFRCLSVIAPLLADEDEKTLITCINCLTKLVSRLSQEELISQLPSFLPAVFEAFGNQSADVRKTVVFCLVDIYIMLGKAFLPYLEGLNSTQLKLVTIYANRISQARTGMAINGGGTC